jgi:hypothetical protein
MISGGLASAYDFSHVAHHIGIGAVAVMLTGLIAKVDNRCAFAGGLVWVQQSKI